MKGQQNGLCKEFRIYPTLEFSWSPPSYQELLEMSNVQSPMCSFDQSWLIKIGDSEQSFHNSIIKLLQSMKSVEKQSQKEPNCYELSEMLQKLFEGIKNIKDKQSEFNYQSSVRRQQRQIGARSILFSSQNEKSDSWRSISNTQKIIQLNTELNSLLKQSIKNRVEIEQLKRLNQILKKNNQKLQFQLTELEFQAECLRKRDEEMELQIIRYEQTIKENSSLKERIKDLEEKCKALKQDLDKIKFQSKIQLYELEKEYRKKYKGHHEVKPIYSNQAIIVGDSEQDYLEFNQGLIKGQYLQQSEQIKIHSNKYSTKSDED